MYVIFLIDYLFFYFFGDIFNGNNCFYLKQKKKIYIYIYIMIYKHSPATLLGTPVQLLGNTNC